MKKKTEKKEQEMKGKEQPYERTTNKRKIKEKQITIKEDKTKKSCR